VLVAVSGGVDSMVLAHLLAKYGRNLLDRSQITLLHLDHGWRPESAEQELRTVSSLAESLGVGFLHRKLKSPLEESLSGNWEDDARKKRIEVYEDLAGHNKEFEFVLTAHHRDDVAETVLWRLLRGEFSEGNVGIKFLDSPCLRLFLEVSKEQILHYAGEEEIVFCEDRSNHDVRRVRAWTRKQVFPLLESVYPAVRKTLAGYAHHRFGQERPTGDPGSSHLLENLLQALTSGPLNRPQREALRRMVRGSAPGQVLALPGGAQLKRLKTGWVIEDPSPGDPA
jgi:tRNA(Ile)-lysidine synthase